MIAGLNAGAKPGTLYQYAGTVNTIFDALNFQNSHPGCQTAVAIHGLFKDGVFQHIVMDANQQWASDDLSMFFNDIYYCGMNGDNQPISVDQVGKALAAKNGGTYIGGWNPKVIDSGFHFKLPLMGGTRSYYVPPLTVTYDNVPDGTIEYGEPIYPDEKLSPIPR